MNPFKPSLSREAQENYASKINDAMKRIDLTRKLLDQIVDVVTIDMLRAPAILKAYDVITPVIPDLVKALSASEPLVNDSSTFGNVDIAIDVTDVDTNLKIFKHPVENFLHVLAQKDFRFWHTGCFLSSNVPTVFQVRLEFGTWSISVKHPAMNVRNLWAQCILVALLYKVINHFSPDNLALLETALKKTKIMHEMDEPKQPIEDTLAEVEVTKVAENTEITQEVDDSSNVFIRQDNMLQEISTTEELSKLSPIAERFVRIFNTSQSFNITDTPNQQKFALDLPSGLYSFFDNTIVSALRSYTLIKTDIEILIKINANQAQCGRYIVAAYPCRTQSQGLSNFSVKDSVWRMLQREHAIVDLSKSNDVHLTVTYENLRPWLPIQTDESGTVTGGSFSTVVMRCLSPLRIADTGNPVAPYQVFARLKNTVLSGMRFPVALPAPAATPVPVFEMMSIVDEAAKTSVSAAKSIPTFGPLFGLAADVLGKSAISIAKLSGNNQDKVKEYENRLNYIGITNKDRPIDISHPEPLLPTPVHSYAYGRTAYSSKKLRLEPEATTPHMPEHKTVNDTQSITELAQIPGFVGSFTVSNTNSQGDLLVELPAIPFDTRYTSLYPSPEDTVVQYPPVTYFFHMFNYYSGSIIYEFVPVKTPSHNFAIQVGFVPFHGTPGDVTESQLQSCRWKTIDFRTSENGQFTVPWLSNSVVRATPLAQTGYLSAYSDINASNNAAIRNTFFEMEDPGKVVVRLVNELNPTPIVSPTIEVLVFVKAHPNLKFMSPTSSRAPLAYAPGLEKMTRTYAADGLNGVVRVPIFDAGGNLDFSGIRYEMQSGDEQTLKGDDLREASGPQVQTFENHDNILDICRRFYLQTTVYGVFSAKVGASVTNPFPPFSCVPITPYSIYIHPLNETGEFLRTQPMTTPRDALLSCFRWMRGTVDVVVHSLTDIPLEVTYLPAVDYPFAINGGGGDDSGQAFSYVPIITSNNTIPVFSLPQAAGQPTELLEPRLNPILTVEPPMYNLNNYIDLQSMLMRNNYGITNETYLKIRNTISDFSANYLGNLVIRGVNGRPVPFTPTTFAELPASNFKVRVITSLGDDCVLQHFMGVPPTYNNVLPLKYNMTTAPVSFRMRNEMIPKIIHEMTTPITCKDRMRTRNEIEIELTAAGIEKNPGPVVSENSFFHNFGLGIPKPFTAVTNMMSDLKQLVGAPKQLATKVEELKLHGHGLVEQIKTVLAAYTDGISVLDISALAFSILASLQKGASIFSMLSVICQILRLTGAFHVDVLSRAMTKLAVIFGNEKTEKETFEMDNDTIPAMASVFTSIIMETFFAYNSVDKESIRMDDEYVKKVFIRTFKNFNVMRSGAICILLTRLCSAVKVLWNTLRKWVRGLERHDILTDDPDFLKGFMADYEFFMDERNLAGQSLLTSHRDRFWITVITAYYLQGILATVNKKHVNTTLSTAIKDIITRANHLKSHMTVPPVRYEPYSLWFWGEPGTGKTTLMLDMTITMCKNIGIVRNGDPIYVRSPHSPWWNGYDGSPITMIDDANGVNDPTILGRMISEFQATKTSAKMRIEMPRLEEKNAEMNSVILAVCSNMPEWISTMIVDKEAFRRRRDMLVKVCWSPAAEEWFRNNPSQSKVASRLPERMLEKNEHVVFQVSNDPLKNDLNGKIYDYAEFSNLLKEHHMDYHQKECEKMMKRYEKSLSLSKQFSERVMDRTTLKTALMAVILGSDTSEVMSETMKSELLRLKEVCPKRFAELPAHTQSILNSMNAIKHEAPAFASDESLYREYANASEWCKTVVFPRYSVGDHFGARFSHEFRPWIYEEMRAFESDILNTPCAVCAQSQSHERRLRVLCPSSTAENQHWMCNTCWNRHVQIVGNESCPVCRHEGLIKISDSQNDWRFHTRVAHVMKTLVKKIAQPVKVTLQVIWENAAILSYMAFLGVLSYSVISNHLAEVREEAIFKDDLNDFIWQYGYIPERHAILNGTCVFTAGNYVYRKDPNSGEFYPSVGSSGFRIDYEAGKRKDKSVTPGTSKVSTTNSFDALADQKHITFEELCKAQTIEKKTSVSEASSEEFHDILESLDLFKDVPVVACCKQHSDETIYSAFKRTVKPIVHFEEDKFVVNVKDEEIGMNTLCVPVVKCESENCRSVRLIRELLELYHEQNDKKWLEKLTNGVNPFEEEHVPDFIKEAYLQKYPLEEPQVQLSRYQRFVDYQVELLALLRGRVVNWFCYIYEQLCQKWYYIISFIALSFAIFYGIRYYYSEEEGVTLEPQHESSQPRETGKGRKVEPNTRLYIKRAPAVHEIKLSVSDKLPDQVKNIADLIMKNSFTVKFAGIDVQGLVIMNNIGLFPRHAYSLISRLQQEKEPITIVNTDGNVFLLEQSMSLHVIDDFEKCDFVLLQHKKLTGKDIRHHIFTTVKDEVSYAPYAYGVDLQMKKVVPVQVVSVTQPEPEDEVKTIETSWNVKGNEYTYKSKLYDHITVSGFRGPGKCGSPLLNPDGKIIGIHFAGMTVGGIDYGFSAPIMREFFGSIAQVEETDASPKLRLEMNEFPNLKFYSHYPNPPYHTEKTKLRPSAIAENAWESITKPCIQSDKDSRYAFGSTPLLDGASTIGAVTNPPEPFVLRSAVRALTDELLRYMPSPSMPVPVSIEEAVTAENHSNVESMNLSTSAGLPWIADFPNKNLKSHYIDHLVTKSGEHRVKLASIFDTKYNVQYNMRLSGIPPREPFWAHLKDERRKEAKLLSYGGTRVFNVSPLELVVSSRRALLPIMDAFHADPVRLHHAIGLSPDSYQWTELIESLRKKSSYIVQLDFSKFSDSMPWEFVHGAFDVIIGYYEKYNLMTPEVDNLLNTIKYEITQSLLCVGSEVYELMNGVLQGHPITSLINSLVNLLEQTYVWIKITGLSGSEFFQRCGIVVMGDDVVIAVPKKLLKVYNGVTIAREFARMNIVVTDETKDKDNIQKFQHIKNFDFLSCSYALHPYRNLYLAPSDPESIFDTALWIKRKDGPYFDATRENVEQSLMNCFGHGPCIYEMYRETLEFLTGFKFRSWYELDYLFYKDEGILQSSVVCTNLGVVTGMTPRAMDNLKTVLLGSDDGIPKEYWNPEFLANVTLDLTGTEANYYRCTCRYDCENELLKRIKQVEIKTGVSRSLFLSFMNQDEGARVLGKRMDANRLSKAKGAKPGKDVTRKKCDNNQCYIAEGVECEFCRIIEVDENMTNYAFENGLRLISG